MKEVIAGAVALVAALVLTPLVRRAALRFGVVAKPGGRHVHEGVIATGGGVAIYLAFWVAVMATSWPLGKAQIGILVASALLLAVCLVDDVRSLHAAPRFLGHIVVAYIVYAFGTRVTGLHNPLAAITGGPGYISVGAWSGPLTVMWVVFMINAMNWIDGLDGLAAGVCGIAAVTLAIMAGQAHAMIAVAVMAAALAGACFGFLRYNFHPASVFMGDTGAMFLGLLLACTSVTGAFKVQTAVAVIAPVLVLGVPIYDVLSTIVGRARAGRPIYNADKTHLHHRLLKKGLTTTQTVLVIYGLTLLLSLVALGLWFR